MLFSSLITFGVLAAGLVLHAAGIHAQSGSAAAIVLALNGLLATYFFRPAEHRLVTDFAFDIRAKAALLTLASFGGAGILTTTVSGIARWLMWLLLTIFAALPALGIGVSWWFSWHVWESPPE
jgi:hypothetical protein